MEFKHFELEGLSLAEPRRFGDARGFFSETFRADDFERDVGPIRFVQDNHSHSARRGTIRGLHYQKRPRPQGKLVRVIRGAVFDVAVDIRRGSPTFGKFASLELSAENWRQLWAPPGFLHGFCTLVDDTEVIYKVTDFYSAAHDAAVAWDDPDIGVPWPVTASEATLSDKDRAAPRLRDVGEAFVYSSAG